MSGIYLIGNNWLLIELYFILCGFIMQNISVEISGYIILVCTQRVKYDVIYVAKRQF